MFKLDIDILAYYHILLECDYTYTRCEPVKCVRKSFAIITIEMNLQNRVQVKTEQNISSQSSWTIFLWVYIYI